MVCRVFANTRAGNSPEVTVVGLYTRRAVTASPSRQRSLASYLLLPRPKDVAKGWLVVTTCALGMLSTGEASGVLLLRALLVVAVLELLVYQARYQWNDVRGFVADQRHPSSAARGRLPGPLDRARSHVSASCAVAGVKLAFTALLVLALPGLHLGGVVGFAVAGVFGAAIAYEALRSASTGRPRATATPTLSVVLLWLAVGSGYAVRGLVGLALAVDPSRRPALFVAAAVTLWCYGIAFVTCRWAVEVTAFATFSHRRVVWNARPDQAREHQVALTRWLPANAPDDVTDIAHWAPLSRRTPLAAPWNVAIVIAGAGAAVAGRLLAGACSLANGIVVAAVGGALAAAVIVWWRRRTLFTTACGLLSLGALAVTGTPRPLLAVAPWLLLMAAYLFASTRTLARLSRRSRGTRLARRAIESFARLVVGEATWQAVQHAEDVV